MNIKTLFNVGDEVYYIEHFHCKKFVCKRCEGRGKIEVKVVNTDEVLTVGCELCSGKGRKYIRKEYHEANSIGAKIKEIRIIISDQIMIDYFIEKQHEVNPDIENKVQFLRENSLYADRVTAIKVADKLNKKLELKEKAMKAREEKKNANRNPR